MNNNSLERTLSIIKPDAVERGLDTKIKKIEEYRDLINSQLI